MQNYLSYSKQVTNWAIYCLQHYQSHEKCRNSIFCRLRSVSSCMRESAGRNVSIRSYNALTCGDMLCRATTSQSLRRPVPSGPANMTRQFQKLVRPKRGQSAQDHAHTFVQKKSFPERRRRRNFKSPFWRKIWTYGQTKKIVLSYESRAFKWYGYHIPGFNTLWPWRSKDLSLQLVPFLETRFSKILGRYKKTWPRDTL